MLERTIWVGLLGDGFTDGTSVPEIESRWIYRPSDPYALYLYFDADGVEWIVAIDLFFAASQTRGPKHGIGDIAVRAFGDAYWITLHSNTGVSHLKVPGSETEAFLRSVQNTRGSVVEQEAMVRSAVDGFLSGLGL